MRLKRYLYVKFVQNSNMLVEQCALVPVSRKRSRYAFIGACVLIRVNSVIHSSFENSGLNEPHVRKPDFSLCKNKGADQLRGNRKADQHLCFHYLDSTIPLLLKSEISSF